MKKSIFKTITILIVVIFASSCETNDENDLLLIDENPTVSSSESAIGSNKSSNKWRITKYEGTTTYMNGETIPHVGSYIYAEGLTNPTLRWNVAGGFEIVGPSNQNQVKIKRISREAGTILYSYHINGKINTSYRNFIEIPDSIVTCPTGENVKMYGNNLNEKYRQSSVSVGSYNSSYTYKWKVVNNGYTRYYSRKSHVFIPSGGSDVTITVSTKGCPIQTKTKFFWSRYAGPINE
ncbi:hypothetical protein ATE84_0955 [Aquimarina sp. MAR_2010_214]|uniref:hypothetical protein n=1 Tax=Aquimarina sp. MAR_2010_214 TaxID=1250026 RepID=UPI000C70DDC0|nr:hypothetical protein [Aquimarina sp. MAR_2010_214]PKV48939.1 hypothetical protein ATE84_0955 [Aquimarina sp. MAR_2010_214]